MKKLGCSLMVIGMLSGLSAGVVQAQDPSNLEPRLDGFVERKGAPSELEFQAKLDLIMARNALSAKPWYCTNSKTALSYEEKMNCLPADGRGSDARKKQLPNEGAITGSPAAASGADSIGN